MVYIKPFKGIRPAKTLASQVACKPYDVINKQEARAIARDNNLSFLHVIKPEIDLPDTVNEYSPEVYRKGKDYLQQLINEGVFEQDKEDYLYVYAQTMDGRTQYGLMACAAASDYAEKKIKVHELTRPDKEEDRCNHIRYSNYHYEPVFFTYHANSEIDSMIADVVNLPAEYDFTADDNIRHTLWVIRDKKIIDRIVAVFKTIPCTYVADGHHRTAAAATVALERSKESGEGEHSFFLAVHFPDTQLKIFDYNRLVKDLNGLDKNKFIEKLKETFDIENKGTAEYKPNALHNFSMYIDGNWYSLTARPGIYNDNDPIGCLDVTVLSDHVFNRILGVDDLRKTKRIDFVGGIRGLGELKKRVDSGEMVAAFALYPVSMKQLTDIADTNNIMPPKTTWFEPKLRSGLVLHML